MQSALPVVELVINGKTWQQVPSLDQSMPGDRHFVVVVDGERAEIHFGDGKHGARPPGGSRCIRVPYQAGTGYLHLVLQQGRAAGEQDRDEEAQPRQVCGLYRAVVVDNLDPLHQMRLKVQVPQASGLAEVWANACLPAGASSLPPTGKHVWVMYEHGDLDYPVWMGVIRD